MTHDSYRRLAERLDALPNGFPPTQDGTELRLLAKIFTPEEAELAAQLRLTRETPPRIASRIGADPAVLTPKLKGMARRGLISWGRGEEGLSFGLLPFVVGIFENQVESIDTELAHLYEEYYGKAFGTALAPQPAVHRVVPVGESVEGGIEVHPFESVVQIVTQAQSWGVLDCICRKQKALIGKLCDHPIDVCMALSEEPNAFEHSTFVRPLDLEGAMQTLRRAADAGLVHSVSNTVSGTSYICNCCTCSCGILRGIAEVGVANVIARSAFVTRVDEELCVGCDLCLDRCQFGALSKDTVVRVDRVRCVGCGLCISSCPEKALLMERRSEDEILPVPADLREWETQRAVARGKPLENVL
jgi:ferredoxin